jgi:hypothetical protein
VLFRLAVFVFPCHDVRAVCYFLYVFER